MGILEQLGGPETRVIEPRIDVGTTGSGDGGGSPTKVLEEGGEKAAGEVQSGGGGTDAKTGLSPQESGASLLSQFPPTQAMPRAVTQSPIPLPPGGDREQVTPENDDAMRMSPPATAG